MAFLLASFVSVYSFAAAPEVNQISPKSINQADQLVVQPELANTSDASPVNWSLAYGPDGVVVNPVTGTLSWQVPEDLPTESFHIGLRASNLDGAAIETFIVHVGVNRVVYIGPNEDVKDFAQAFSARRSPGSSLRDKGMTFVVRNGTYWGDKGYIGLTGPGNLQNPPAGDANHYTTIMAEDPGQVTLKDGGIWAKGLNKGVHYWAIKGFHMDRGRFVVDGSGCNDDQCRPHHLKFIRNGIEIGPGGQGSSVSHAHNILMENNYAFGGSRNKFLAYKAKYSVYRRNVARFDFNQRHTGPTNTFAFYTSMNISAQNNIAIDGSMKFVAPGQNAGEFGCPTTAGQSEVTFDRSIQLNSEHIYGNIDRQAGPCDAEIRDTISWDIRPIGSLVMTRAPSWFDHATIGEIHSPISGQTILNGWPGDRARGITNSVLHNLTNGPLFEGFSTGTTDTVRGTLDRYGLHHLNISSFNGPLFNKNNTMNNGTVSDHNPIWSKSNPNGGLRYLVRVEANSNLAGKGSDGKDLGANATTFKGFSGTLSGQSGFNRETNIPSWPFPYQEVIAEKMRGLSYNGPTWSTNSYSRSRGSDQHLSGNRGFAKTDTNLTDYIWGYMGSAVPPMNVNAAAAPGAVIVRWDPQASGASDTITGYKVYDYDPDTQAISNPRDVGLTNTATITGLSNSDTYHFAVTAVDSEKGESSWSYPVSMSPNGRPRPMPPTLRLRNDR